MHDYVSCSDVKKQVRRNAKKCKEMKKDTFRTRAEAVLPLFFAAGSMVDLLAGTTHVCKKHASKAETHQYTARAPFAGSADVNFHLVLSKDTSE